MNELAYVCCSSEWIETQRMPIGNTATMHTVSRLLSLRMRAKSGRALLFPSSSSSPHDGPLPRPAAVPRPRPPPAPRKDARPPLPPPLPPLRSCIAMPSTLPGVASLGRALREQTAAPPNAQGPAWARNSDVWCCTSVVNPWARSSSSDVNSTAAQQQKVFIPKSAREHTEEPSKRGPRIVTSPSHERTVTIQNAHGGVDLDRIDARGVPFGWGLRTGCRSPAASAGPWQVTRPSSFLCLRSTALPPPQDCTVAIANNACPATSRPPCWRDAGRQHLRAPDSLVSSWPKNRR